MIQFEIKALLPSANEEERKEIIIKSFISFEYLFSFFLKKKAKASYCTNTMRNNHTFTCIYSRLKCMQCTIKQTAIFINVIILRLYDSTKSTFLP